MNREALEGRLTAEFGCSRSDARVISGKAAQLKAEMESGPESWDEPEIDPDYIVSRLDMAPPHLSATAKWDWWAGTMGYFGGSRRDYRIG